MTELEAYYNKFNEDKRLLSRHGRVEFITSMKYIHMYLGRLGGAQGNVNSKINILDVGAATGRYSIPLADEGYCVTAVEPVQHNLGRLKAASSKVKAYKGNALDLRRFCDNTFDLVLLFGPLYHLHGFAEKCQALSEARRVAKPGGFILAAYIMNEYAVITHAFKEKNILPARHDGMLDETFRCQENANPLYSFVRLEDIDALNKASGLIRSQIISADGAANYIRPYLNALSEEEFSCFIDYHLATCERMDLIGAGAHTVDIVQKPA